MKKLLLVMAFVSVSAAAQDLESPSVPAVPAVPQELAVSGLPRLLSDKIKELRPAILTTFGGKPGAAAYLPIWTWNTAAGVPLVEFPTIGYRTLQGARPDMFTHFAVNLPGISSQLFGGQWFAKHVKKSPFPPIFLGPAMLVPLNLSVIEKLQVGDWKKYMAVVASARF